MRRWQIILIGLGVTLDVASKRLAESFLSFWVPKSIVGSLLSFQLVHNHGAAYGIFQNQRFFLLGISSVVIVAGFIFSKNIGTNKWARLGLALLLIGTIGNFIDRLMLGYVVDFIDIRIFPVFNIADVCIDCGIGCFLVDMVSEGRGSHT
jgi:signal peptidase II